MKNKHLIIPLIATGLALGVPSVGNAQAEPGKSSDTVKEPAAKASESGRAAGEATTADKEPGKTSDSVRENAAASENQFHGKVTSVSSENKTITIEDRKLGSHTMHVGESTTLKKANGSATFSDLKVGETVVGTCKKLGDKTEAATIQIGG